MLARFPTEEYLRVVNPIKVFYFLIVIYYYPLLKRIGYLRLSIRLMPASRLQADRFFIPCSIPVRQLADSLFSLCLHGLQKFQGCDPIVIFYFLIVIWPPAPNRSFSSRFYSNQSLFRRINLQCYKLLTAHCLLLTFALWFTKVQMFVSIYYILNTRYFFKNTVNLMLIHPIFIKFVVKNYGIHRIK